MEILQRYGKWKNQLAPTSLTQNIQKLQILGLKFSKIPTF
jgi:hypothetical protein